MLLKYFFPILFGVLTFETKLQMFWKQSQKCTNRIGVDNAEYGNDNRPAWRGKKSLPCLNRDCGTAPTQLKHLHYFIASKLIWFKHGNKCDFWFILRANMLLCIFNKCTTDSSLMNASIITVHLIDFVFEEFQLTLIYADHRWILKHKAGDIYIVVTVNSSMKRPTML